MNPSGGFLPNVVIGIPVRFIPPDTHTQQTVQFYIYVRAGADADEIKAAAREQFGNLVANLNASKYMPFASLLDYELEILPITATPREQ